MYSASGMIKTLIFDLGGVVISHKKDLMPVLIGETFHIGTENAREIWRRHKDALLTGELPSGDFLQKIKVETGSSDTMHSLMDLWKRLYERDALGINTELLSLISKLRKKYAVYLLTDTLDVHHAFNEERGVYSHFDGAYYSHLEGKSKSQGERTFNDFLKKFSLRAHECVFTDDMEAYVEIAQRLGIHGIVFTSNADFLKQLTGILSEANRTP